MEVEAMLHASAASWNGGDLEGFLDDYWRSEDLTFSGEDGVTRGWDDVRTRYLNSYWAEGATRDSLRFEAIEVTELGQEHALALGQYVLFRPKEGGIVSATGFFSLVLEKMEGGWKILHDHTSAAPDPLGPQGDRS
jgi:beta-aspartyl-peptidase (threonine type)